MPRPPGGALTRQQIVRLVADLKSSESKLSACGKRVLSWYDTQAQALGGGAK